MRPTWSIGSPRSSDPLNRIELIGIRRTTYESPTPMASPQDGAEAMVFL
jgi:hypothetical protein